MLRNFCEFGATIQVSGPTPPHATSYDLKTGQIEMKIESGL